jgi:hypothetical protein
VAATTASIVVAFGWSYAWYYKLLTKLARFLKASDRYGDDGIMAAFLSSEQLHNKGEWLGRAWKTSPFHGRIGL